MFNTFFEWRDEVLSANIRGTKLFVKGLSHLFHVHALNDSWKELADTACEKNTSIARNKYYD